MAKGLAGIKITENSRIGVGGTEVSSLQDSEEIMDVGSNLGSAAYCM